MGGSSIDSAARHGLAAITLTGLMLAGTARAEPPSVTFSGFGTVAATYADTQVAEFRSSWRQDRGSRGKVDWGVDSRLALQLNASFGETFSGAAQAIALRRDGRDELEMEWLYGQAAFGPDLWARAGRLVLPTFMQSDVRNVGYAQHWVRAPAEVYLGLPITSVDGLQLLYRHTWENITFTVQPTIGQANAVMFFDVGSAGRLYGQHAYRDIKSLNLSAEMGSWIARFGETTTRDRAEWSNAPSEVVDYRFTNLGVQYDDGKTLALAEWVAGRTGSGRYDLSGYYVSAGRRIGQWLPYAIYSEQANKGSVIASRPTSRTQALGLRWNVATGVAIKAQAERSRYSGQQFLSVDSSIDKRSSANVYTLAVDFIF